MRVSIQARAQETVAEVVSPTPQSEVSAPAPPSSSELEDSAGQSVEPTIEVTAAPTETVAPTVEPTITEEPTIQPTTAIAPETTQTQEQQKPQDQRQTNTAETPAPTTEATATPVPPTATPQLDEQISTTIVKLDGSYADPALVPETWTDKADYAPTEKVVVNGKNFVPNSQYNIAISSTDPPAVTHNGTFTTTGEGIFTYEYQLDGNYRPNYKVEVKDGSGTVVASTTFTDGPIICAPDANGANDQPGQKDLTKMCFDMDTSASVKTTWQWDEIAWSGNNTGDACNLFDTDNDGNANFALCVIIGNSPAVIQSTTLYSCDDSRSDRCKDASALVKSSSTVCTVDQNTEDPFTAGALSPQDTEGSCSIVPSDVGGTSSKLLYVCSYPSQQPNSNPSDCIAAVTGSSGSLEVIKSLNPTTDPGKFNLVVNDTEYASGIGHNGTTGQRDLAVGTYTIKETAGNLTSLTDYTSSIECRSYANNGSHTVIASSNTSGPLDVSVTNNSNIVCTITNTRINNGSITIVKDASPDSTQDFAFTTIGTGLSGFSLDDDADNTLSNTKVFSDLAAGTYSVA